MDERLKVVEEYIESLTTISQVKEVQNIIHKRWHEIERDNVRTYRIGDRVKWNKGRWEGTVRKINLKTLTVESDIPEKTMWNISASLLSKA